MGYVDPKKQREYTKRWRDKNKSYWREYYKKNKEKIGSTKRRRLYGITDDVFLTMIEAQHGVCLICESPINAKTAHVDHCHSKGHVRGLLCKRCNFLLGQAKENIETLIKASEYLRHHGTDQYKYK
jgi:hypothetical protein